MARIMVRALPLASRSPLPPPAIAAALWGCTAATPAASPPRSPLLTLSAFAPSPPARAFHVSARYSHSLRPFAGFFVNLRGFRKVRRRQAAAKKQPTKEKQLELDVQIAIEEELPDDPEVLGIAEMLKLNVPMAMKIAFDGLKDSEYKTRDTSISDVGKYEKVELSVLLCNDNFIQNLNKDWRGEDHATDVLSMSQHIPDLDLPILMLGDIVISVETATRQAEERGHTLLDEVRILMVHGLLHLLGLDHEINDEAEAEMEKEEELVLKSLGWKGKGLIKSAHDAANDSKLHAESSDGRSLLMLIVLLNLTFLSQQGTLLNSKSQITTTTAEALREAILRGVNIVIATGKARPAVISALKMVGLAGKNGVVSEFSPGIFLQGLLVYGRRGREICRRNLDKGVCRKAFSYSVEHEIPLVAFCQDRCFTLFDHPLIDSLHTVYHEPKKLLFVDTPEGITSTLRPHWEEATDGLAGVVQAVPDMLEIVPAGTSKGSGVKMLLDHLGISPKEVMAIGDGENDVEMLQVASLGVALANGSEKTKAVANVIGATNDEDGAAKAIYEYAF
ncbi:Sugar phosphatase YidA [Ananas comosus]|uniref:Sugar phosphatase YidA n=1 Tax=Ananas comosus TaxID=4615 RepID=A0A199UY21_ANACO|nr:Sugar phosphatase YidA [Ananas comosus]